MKTSVQTSSVPLLSAMTLALLISACSSPSGVNTGLGSPEVEATDVCAPTGSGIGSGTTVKSEEYNQGFGVPAFDPANESCWKSYRSANTSMQPSDYTSSFANRTIGGGAAQNVRELRVAYRSGIQSNLGVDYAPFTTPATGWDSGQWPYLIDLFKDTQCYADVEVVAQLKPFTSPGGSEIYGVLLNSKVTGDGATRKISGYLIHLNGGGASATLVKYDKAYDRAFDFLDHFPGYNLPPVQPNPLTDGPYKGWDFKNTAWAAGGFPNQSAEVTVAARYRYDFNTQAAQIDWEVRPSTGVDSSPGAYDKSRTLTGSDALIPGGGYGLYTALYGSLAAGTTNGLAIGSFKLTCRNP